MTVEEIQKLRCPRWGELPNLSLYMDQVLLVLEQNLGIFADDKERVVTSTMINNYVKHKLVQPPEKKKYGRQQVAELIVVSILKKVLSMNEIRSLLQALADEFGFEKGYNLFCERLENLLLEVFKGKGWQAIPQENTASTQLDAALAALCAKLYFQSLLPAEESVDS